MNLMFEPNVGALPLVFGTPRSEIRAMIKPTTEPKTHATEPENDFYSGLGLILGFDEDDKLEFVEVFPPSDAKFGTIDLLSTYKAVTARMAALGLEITSDGPKREIRGTGIVLFCPKEIESASIHKPGYYERHKARNARRKTLPK